MIKEAACQGYRVYGLETRCQNAGNRPKGRVKPLQPHNMCYIDPRLVIGSGTAQITSRVRRLDFWYCKTQRE